MAIDNYLNQSGDWSAAANWGTGAAPTSSDIVAILNGTYALTTSLPAAAAGVNYAGFQLGPGFSGTIGTGAAPLYLGSVTARIDWQGVNCSGAHLAVDTGDTCAIDVRGTGPGLYALALYGPGTWSEVNVQSAQKVYIGASAVVTLLVVHAGARVYIESGATVTTIINQGGVIDNYAAVTTINQADGVFMHLGSTTFNVTTLNNYGGTFKFFSGGGTITTANMHGGTLNADGGNGAARVITTLARYGGSVNLNGLGANVTVTNDYARGGEKVVGGVGTSPGPAS